MGEEASAKKNGTRRGRGGGEECDQSINQSINPTDIIIGRRNMGREGAFVSGARCWKLWNFGKGGAFVRKTGSKEWI